MTFNIGQKVVTNTGLKGTVVQVLEHCIVMVPDIPDGWTSVVHKKDVKESK